MLTALKLLSATVTAAKQYVTQELNNEDQIHYSKALQKAEL